MSTMNSLLKTFFWVKLSYWLEALSPSRLEFWMSRDFPSVTDKWPFQDHLLSKTMVSTQWTLSPGRPKINMHSSLPQCHHYVAFLKTSSEYNYTSTWWALSSRRPEQWTCQASPVLLMKSLSKNIFQVRLTYIYICHWTGCRLQLRFWASELDRIATLRSSSRRDIIMGEWHHSKEVMPCHGCVLQCGTTLWQNVIIGLVRRWHDVNL